MKKGNFWEKIKYGFIVTATLGSIYIVSNIKIVVDPFLHISKQKTLQVSIDKKPEEESQLELAIEKEFGFDLRLPKGYDPNELRWFLEDLREIKRINPDLLIYARGLDVYILPDSMTELVDYSGRCSPREWIELFPITMMFRGGVVHELDHNFTHNAGHDFFEGLKSIVEKYGFEYGDNLAPPTEMILSDMSTEWIRWEEDKKESQGVFSRPYASNLKKGLPLEHTAVIREHIHTGKPFKVCSRRAYECYMEVFKYEFKNGVLSQQEYDDALALLDPEYKKLVINLTETAKEVGINWGVVAQANDITDVRLKEPITLGTHSNEVSNPKFCKTIEHRIKSRECLSGIALKYRRQYPIVTINYIMQYNPQIINPDFIMAGDVLRIPIRE